MSDPPSEVFRKRLREVRRLKGWTQQDLAAALGASGVEIGEFAIVRLERGPRGVSIDDAIAIAAVLGVSPLHMLVPLDDTDVQLTPQMTVPASDARTWLRGQRPLRKADERLFYIQTPESEADWFPAVPGPWRSENPDDFKATRARWEREILREVVFPASGGQQETWTEDIQVSRPQADQDQDPDRRDHR